MKEKVWNIMVAIGMIIYALVAILLLIVADKNIFFDGWWTLILILPACGSLLFQSNKRSSFFILLVGIDLLLTCLKVLTVNKCFIILLSLVIIFIGLNIIFVTLNKPAKKDGIIKNVPLYYAIFGVIEEYLPMVKFDGGRIISLFGSSVIDFTNTKIENNANLKVKSIFGSSEIVLPENVEVVSKNINILGGTENYKQNHNKRGRKIRLYVDSFSLFGSFKIR